MGWKRTNDCLMCGQARCLEDRDEKGVGYCYRYSTMHRHGKPFIKKGVRPECKKNLLRTVLKGGMGGNFSEKFSTHEERRQVQFAFEESVDKEVRPC